MSDDLSRRVLCDYEECNGFYNENWVCNICGKPKSKPRSYKLPKRSESDFFLKDEPILIKIIVLLIVLFSFLLGLLILGGCLFLLVTIFLALKKFAIWAWH